MERVVETHDESLFDLPYYDLFHHYGTVSRKDYKREWVGPDYLIRRGRFQGKLLSEVDREKWLVWALNTYEGKLPKELERALIDQINSLHK